MSNPLGEITASPPLEKWEKKGMHESPTATKEEWLTPPWLLARLGKFDLDPCAPADGRRPWDMAVKHYSIDDNGLNKPWHGRVWLNPPYGTKMAHWLSRLADHGNGIALIHARTDTSAFFDFVWDTAAAILFLKGRLFFFHVNGKVSDHNAGAPSCLVAYGAPNVEALRDCADLGKVIPLASQSDAAENL